MNAAEQSSKIAIIGTGMVGSSLAYALTIKGTAREIALIDIDRKKAEGEAMDLNHCLSFIPPLEITSGGYELCRDARVVVITAGAAQNPGETRLDLAGKNARITTQIVEKVLEHNPSPIFLITTNPVDVLTYAALKSSGLPANRVIGSGTVLDSSRFRYLLSEQYGIDSRSVHAYVIGEHGDSEVPLWSHVHVAGMPLVEFCPACGQPMSAEFMEKIVNDVRNAAYEVIDRKGATYYAIGLSLVRILEAIMNDQRSVLTVSSLVRDYYGLENVCLSLPSVVGAEGIVDVLHIKLTEDEEAGLKKSALVLQRVLESLGYN